MKKVIRIVLGLMLVFAAIVGALLWNTTPLLRRIKPQLESIASNAVGQPVQLGDLSLKVVPSIAIEAAGASLGTGAGASIEHVSLKAKLVPLLRGSVEVTDLSLQGMKLQLTRTKSGQLKLGDLTLGGPPHETTAEAPVAPRPAPAEEKKVALAIQRAQLLQSEFVFRDELPATGPSEVRVADINFVLDNITTDSVGSLDLTATALGSKPKNLHLSGSFTRAAAPAGPLPLPGSGKLQLGWEQISLSQLSSLINSYGGGLPPGVTLANELTVSFQANADSSPSVSVSVDASGAAIQVGDSFRKDAGKPLTFAAVLEPAALAAKISKCILTIGTSQISASGTLQPLTQAAQLELTSDRIDLADLSAMTPAAASFRPQGNLGMKLAIAASPSAPLDLGGSVQLRDVALVVPAGDTPDGGNTGLPITGLAGEIQLAKDTVTVKPLTFAVAGQKFEAGTKIVSLSAPSIQLALKSESISLEAIGKGLRNGGMPALSGAELKGVQLAGTYSVPQKKGGATLNLASGTLSGLPLGTTKLAADAALSESGAPELITLQPSTLALFGGSVSVNGSLQSSKQLAAGVQAAKLDIAKLAAFAGKEGFTGTLSNLTTTVHGDTSRLSETLSGPVAVEAVSGTIPGVNVLGQTLGGLKDVPALGAVITGLVPEKYRPLVQANSTAYDSVKVRASLAGGTTTLQSFELVHQLYHLTGSGTIEKNGALSLSAQMRLTPMFVESIGAKEPKIKLLLDADKYLVVPVVIRKSAGGTPIVLPDVTDLGKRALTNTSKEAGKKALDKVAPGLGTAIDSLFR